VEDSACSANDEKMLVARDSVAHMADALLAYTASGGVAAVAKVALPNWRAYRIR